VPPELSQDAVQAVLLLTVAATHTLHSMRQAMALAVDWAAVMPPGFTNPMIADVPDLQDFVGSILSSGEQRGQGGLLACLRLGVHARWTQRLLCMQLSASTWVCPPLCVLPFIHSLLLLFCRCCHVHTKPRAGLISSFSDACDALAATFNRHPHLKPAPGLTPQALSTLHELHSLAAALFNLFFELAAAWPRDDEVEQQLDNTGGVQVALIECLSASCAATVPVTAPLHNTAQNSTTQHI
jgi:hypothetical protein